MTLVASWRPDLSLLTWESRARIPKFKKTAAGTRRRSARGRRSSHTERALAVVDELRVVLSMAAMWSASKAWASRGCRPGHGAESQEARLGDVVMVGRRGRHQTPSDDVERHDGQDHSADDQPLLAVQASTQLGHSAGVDGPNAASSLTCALVEVNTSDNIWQIRIVCNSLPDDRPFTTLIGILWYGEGRGTGRGGGLLVCRHGDHVPRSAGAGSRRHDGSCWRSSSPRWPYERGGVGRGRPETGPRCSSVHHLPEPRGVRASRRDLPLPPGSRSVQLPAGQPRHATSSARTAGR